VFVECGCCEISDFVGRPGWIGQVSACSLQKTRSHVQRTGSPIDVEMNVDREAEMNTPTTHSDSLRDFHLFSVVVSRDLFLPTACTYAL
jgi:hypothetical protein